MQHANINLPNGKTLAIDVKNQGKANPYIKSIKLNGKPYAKTFITHAQLLAGGQMEIEMSAMPNKNFGKNKADWPSSIDNN